MREFKIAPQTNDVSILKTCKQHSRKNRRFDILTKTH